MLSKEQLFSKSQKRMLSWNPILTKDSCGSGGSIYRRTRNGKPPPLSSRLFGLKNAGFKNEWLPFFDPCCLTLERTANAFHLLNWVLWLVCDPWMPKASLGWSRSSYGVETMGSAHGFSFLSPHFAQRVEGRLLLLIGHELDQNHSQRVRSLIRS